MFFCSVKEVRFPEDEVFPAPSKVVPAGTMGAPSPRTSAASPSSRAPVRRTASSARRARGTWASCWGPRRAPSSSRARSTGALAREPRFSSQGEGRRTSEIGIWTSSSFGKAVAASRCPPPQVARSTLHCPCLEEPSAIAPAEELTHKCSTKDARKSETKSRLSTFDYLDFAYTLEKYDYLLRVD